MELLEITEMLCLKVQELEVKPTPDHAYPRGEITSILCLSLALKFIPPSIQLSSFPRYISVSESKLHFPKIYSAQ